MFILKLYDREGKELKEGDFVKVSDSKGFTFYAKVGYDEKTSTIYPFHTFSFNSFLKVDKLPEDAKYFEDGKRQHWYIDSEATDKNGKNFIEYFWSWKECERLLEARCYKIEKDNQLKLF